MLFSKMTMIAALGSVLLLPIGIAAARIFTSAPLIGIALFVFSGMLGLVSILSAIVVLFASQSIPTVMIGMLGLLPLITVASILLNGMRFPAINDVATDMDNVPAFTPDNNQQMPDANAAIIREHYPELKPLILDQPPEVIFRQSVAFINEHRKDWQISHVDEELFVIEGIATTKVFRFQDDFVIRIRPDENGGAIVDMRSKSRLGKSDLGANARRIRLFFEALLDLLHQKRN